MNVPFVDLREQNAQVKDEILEMWSEILDTAGFVAQNSNETFTMYERRPYLCFRF